jgi:hypothetical protein
MRRNEHTLKIAAISASFSYGMYGGDGSGTQVVLKSEIVSTMQSVFSAALPGFSARPHFANMACNIGVAVAGDGVAYPCPLGREVGWARDHIRERYGIRSGSINCDGVGADEGELIEAGKTYTFVGGSIQGNTHRFFSFGATFFILIPFPSLLFQNNGLFISFGNS